MPARSIPRRARALLTAAAAGLLTAAVLAPAVHGGDDVVVVSYPDFTSIDGLQLNGTAATLGNPVTDDASRKVLRLVATTGQAGTAFLTSTIQSDASFSSYFVFRISQPSGISEADGVGADGIVFTLQTEDDEFGGGGGGIGYGGLDNSIGIEFDTWRNPEFSDADGNHVGIDTNGSVFSLQAVNVPTRMNDGGIWHAWVDYDGASDLLEVRLVLQTDATIPARPAAAILTAMDFDIPALLDSTTAFAGFTSGSGAAGGAHDILSWTFINAFNPVGENDPPVANAGPDQTVTQTGAATSVTLDGTLSTDPDGDPLTYAWAGPFVGGAATGPNPTVQFATAGAHTVTLTVDDGQGGTDTDDVLITVQAAGTTATATPTPTPSPTPTPTPRTGALPNTAASPDALALGGVAVAMAIVFLASASLLALGSSRPSPQRRR